MASQRNDELLDDTRSRGLDSGSVPGAPGKRSLTAKLAPSAGSVAREVMRLMRKGDRDDNGVAPHADAAVAAAGASPGQPLPDDLRGRFESSLGADLAAVRVHTGSESAAAARSINARAYTIGNDIHFAAGQYAPADPFGVHLLAHEVAHTVQQAGAAPSAQYKLEVSTPGDAAEVEADRAADAMVAGSAFAVGIASRTVDRDCGEGEPCPARDDRGEVLDETKHRMTTAIGQFSVAASELRHALKDAAKAEREMVALAVDVAMGFLIPGLSAAAFSRISARLLPSVLPAGVAPAAELGAHVAALQRLATTQPIVDFLKNSDLCKAAFTGVTKAGIQAIKSNPDLFADSEAEVFVGKLSTAMDIAISDARSALGSKSIGEILATYVAFDPRETNQITYGPVLKDLVARFKQQVGDIKSSTVPLTDPGEHIVETNSVKIITGLSMGPRLAIVKSTTVTQPFVGTETGGYVFQRWVEPLFRDMAVRKSGSAPPQRLAVTAVQGASAAVSTSGMAAPALVTGTYRTNEGLLIITGEEKDEVTGAYVAGDDGRGSVKGRRAGQIVTGRWTSQRGDAAGAFSIDFGWAQAGFTGTQTVDGQESIYQYTGEVIG